MERFAPNNQKHSEEMEQLKRKLNAERDKVVGEMKDELEQSRIQVSSMTGME